MTKRTLLKDIADATSPIGARIVEVAAFTIYVGLYVALIAFFKWVDVYHAQFDATGYVVVVYNLFRILFIFYLFWMVQAAGIFCLRLIADRATVGEPPEQLALGFFTGMGVLHVIMLILGFLSLYNVPVAVALTLALVAMSYSNFRNALAAAVGAFSDWRRQARGFTPLAWLRVAVTAPLAILLLIAAGALLIVKGLYPGGGHDYYIHYFQYYKAVIDRGDLWPNDVWYHFYYSKGAGLYFLSMLITDALAPQLVTFCVVAAATLALFLLLQRLAPRSLWPWIGVILYVGCYIYTPGPALNRSHGGWGDFEKLHELNSALIIAIIWLTAGALEHTGRRRLAWAAAAASAVVAATIINLTIPAFLGTIFVLIAMWCALRRDWLRAALSIGLASTAGLTLATLLLVNQLATGLANDQGILFFWQFADIEKIHRWGALVVAIITHWSVTGLVANSVPLSRDTLWFLWEAFRLDLIYPLIGAGVLIAGLALALRRGQLPAPIQAGVIAAAVVVFIGLSVFAGRSQPISFYRYSSFALPIVIAAGIVPWQVPQEFKNLLVRAIYTTLVPLMVLSACLLSIFQTYPAGPFAAVHINASRFVRGVYSIDTAYTTQGGWPGRLPWGGIYPGARGAYGVVGPHKRIWTFHIHTYCMLPDCNMALHSPSIMTPAIEQVLFEAPEIARQALREFGTDFFLFSRELEIQDFIPSTSPLFNPENVGRYLGIIWSDDKTALLTWIGPNTRPFDGEWLEAYRQAELRSRPPGNPLYVAMRRIFKQLHATPHPWRSFELPWHGNRPY